MVRERRLVDVFLNHLDLPAARASFESQNYLHFSKRISVLISPWEEMKVLNCFFIGKKMDVIGRKTIFLKNKNEYWHLLYCCRTRFANL